MALSGLGLSRRRAFCGAGLGLLGWAVAVSAAEPVRRPRVLFLVGDEEYRTGETVPAWAKEELTGLVDCDVDIDDPQGPARLPGLERLERADALFLSLKRRALEPGQLARLRAHVRAGKPVLGIRTASHAFGARNPGPGREAWDTFDREVFGGHYQNHYGKGTVTLARLAVGAAGHPLARGWPKGNVRFTSHLYRCRDLVPGTQVILEGGLEGDPGVREPAAWVRTDGGRRNFYTSLGSPEDFREPLFRRLLRDAVLWATGVPGAGVGSGRP